MAFAGAVVDVMQIVKRGVNTAEVGAGLDEVAPFIIAQEICFALCIGFRFLFFWAFVAEPPLGELDLSSIPNRWKPNFVILESSNKIHSASWRRWGPLGTLMQFGLLAMILALTVLQLLWRIDSIFSQFCLVYISEATLEILVACLFIIKVVTNVVLSPLEPRCRTFRNYLPMIVALLLSAGLGLGNIIICTFSFRSHDNHY